MKSVNAVCFESRHHKGRRFYCDANALIAASFHSSIAYCQDSAAVIIQSSIMTNEILSYRYNKYPSLQLKGRTERTQKMGKEEEEKSYWINLHSE